MKKKKKNKLSPILVPVDFSNASQAALLFAAELAAALEASITVLHVVHDPGDAPGYYAVHGRDEQLQRLEDIAANMLADFMSKTVLMGDHGHLLKRVKTMVVKGLPVGRIMEVVELIDARMVVMGSTGRTGFHHLMLGSKAQQAVNVCPVPITIVRSTEELEGA